jgi:hypothetical protein
MNFQAIKTVVLAGIFATMIGCNLDPLAQTLGTKITIGMTRDDVDKTLIQLKLGYDFDKETNAYYLIFRNVPFPSYFVFEHDIEYRIYFDFDERVKDVKKEDGYDAP